MMQNYRREDKRMTVEVNKTGGRLERITERPGFIVQVEQNMGHVI